jgi:hypothetical protein
MRAFLELLNGILAEDAGEVSTYDR